MQKNICETVYYADIYLRLSDDDGDKQESNSIRNQRDFITEFLKSMPEIRIHAERKDDGFSGVDFFRPGIQEVLKDVRSGIVNCVVVKDLSRLGRNYIETGKVLQEFAEHSIRFIAINDGYDTANLQGQASSILLPIKNLMNDSYSRDISVKIRSHLEVKKRKGEFVGAFAAYGYLKSPDNKNKLIVDEYAAAVVQDIFRWKLDGMSQQGIADRLDADGVLCPSEYKRSLGMKYIAGFKRNAQSNWSAVAVGRILKNPLYIGTMVQGKTGRPNYKIKKLVEKPQEEWICVENSHEPIISKLDFETVNKLLQTDTRIATQKKTVYPFAGLLFCADCKQNMVRKTVPANGKKYFYYICSTNRANPHMCMSHRINEKRLMDAVQNGIRSHLEAILSIEKTLAFIATLPAEDIAVKKIDRQLDKLKADYEQAMHFKMSAYESYVEHILSEAEFKQYQKVYTEKCEMIAAAITRRQEELDAISKAGSAKSEWIEHFKSFRNVDVMERKSLVKIVEQIYVHEGNRIEIIFKHHNEYRAAVAYIEQHIRENTAQMEIEQCMKEHTVPAKEEAV